MNKNVYLIGNPIAGGGAEQEIKKAQSLLTAESYEVSLFLTQQKGDAERFAHDVRIQAGEAPPLVIAAGGDGTINEVVHGLAGSGIPMAILPFGTTSVLAREIGVPMNNLAQALAYALSGKPRPVALGRITWPDGKTRFFLLMAGIGFDGRVVHDVNPALKRRIGKGAYVLSTVRTVLKYAPNPLFITCARLDGSVVTFKGTSIIVSNASRYGGDFMITPEARLHSPSLEVMIDRSKHPVDFLRMLASIGSGKAIPGAAYETVTSVQVDGVSPLQIDGDESGTTPVVIDVMPDALQLVMKE